MAEVLLAQKDTQKAVRLWGAAHALRENIGSTLPPNKTRDQREKYQEQVAQVRLTLGEEAFSTTWEEGHAMILEQAVEYALNNTEA